MTDNRGPYKVYHLGKYVRSFTTFDEASLWKWDQRGAEDYEILDRSDES